MALHLLVLAGGVGSRLWPVSTPRKPKQFLKLVSKTETLLQATVRRYKAAYPDINIWVSTNLEYSHYIVQQLESYRVRVCLEPEGRNTAPAIRFAVGEILEEDPDARVIISPADAFLDSPVQPAVDAALAHLDFFKSIICIGIKPDRPSEEYGYIALKEQPKEIHSVCEVERFTEKPNAEVAEEYIKNGCVWNAGIFISTASTIVDAFKEFAPEIYNAKDIPSCPKISFDYAIMEKCPYAAVIPEDWIWSDLGSFEAIEKITGKPVLKKRYLFLDIDGVLNFSSHYEKLAKEGKTFEPHWLRDFNPDCVRRVNEILKETGADLVVSSSWRLDSNLKAIFEAVGLPTTFHRTPFCWGEDRGEEIEEFLYLGTIDWRGYCILDDDDDMLEDQLEHFIQTNNGELREEEQGLTEKVKEKAINILLKD